METLRLVATPAVVTSLAVACALYLLRWRLQRVDLVAISHFSDDYPATVVPWRRNSLAVSMAEFTFALVWLLWFGGATLALVLGALYGDLAQEVVLAGLDSAADALGPWYLGLFGTLVAASLMSRALGHASHREGAGCSARLDPEFGSRHNMTSGDAVEVFLVGDEARAELQLMDPVPRWTPRPH
ncbi:hypothetical protein [Ornithinimicrobium murale]|uniref:hypothetical protein n=1 Tax=Ornithinimicrobium murale TaxID=1050153 RepID=UPI0013B3EADC|nr:hypothetical protein [Ornithinimicrobium murale]